MPISIKDFSKRIFSRPLSAEQLGREDAVRKAIAGAGTVILKNTPTCREQSLAVTKLEEASYWAWRALQSEPVANGVDPLKGRKIFLEKLVGIVVGPAKKKVRALSDREIVQAEVYLGLRVPLEPEESEESEESEKT